MKTNGKSRQAVNLLIAFLSKKKGLSTNYCEKMLLGRRILSYNSLLYRLTHDPRVLYQLGDSALSLGDMHRAHLHYRQALYNTSKDDIYHSYAKIAMDKIARGNRHFE